MHVSDTSADSDLAPCTVTLGSRNLAGENNVVQWEDNVGEASLHRMSYNAGRLLVEVEGHYYLYSKLTFNAAEECSLVQHKVLKVTKAYGDAIELMRSKRSAPAPPSFHSPSLLSAAS